METTFDKTSLTVLILSPATVYLVIFIVFMTARRKYKGGVVGDVINLITASVGLLLVADIALFLIPDYGFLKIYTIHVVLKILAMLTLAAGGLKFFVK
jgi:hypothetical protein